jgi:hypothetical protein
MVDANVKENNVFGVLQKLCKLRSEVLMSQKGSNN